MGNPSKTIFEKLDTEEHHVGTKAVLSKNTFVNQQPLRQTTGTAVGSQCVVRDSE